MTEPVRVGDVLAGFPGFAERLAEARLLAAWPEIAGPAGARSRAEGVEDGVLQVAVASSGWLHRLTLDEPTLLTRCRALIPVPGLRAIRFHLAPLSPAGGVPPAPSDPAPESAGTGPGEPPDDALEAVIAAALAPVQGHPGIAEALGRAMRATRRKRGEGEVSR